MPAARTSDSNDICQANLETGLKIDQQHFSSSRLSFCEQMTDAMCVQCRVASQQGAEFLLQKEMLHHQLNHAIIFTYYSDDAIHHKTF